MNKRIIVQYIIVILLRSTLVDNKEQADLRCIMVLNKKI